MNKRSSNAYQNAAERVQCLFSKGLRDLFNLLFNSSIKHPISHRCNFLKFPRNLSVKLSLGKRNFAASKNKLHSVEDLNKNLNAAAFDVLQEAAIEKDFLDSKKYLNPSRVRGVKLKESRCAAQKLKEACHELKLKYVGKKHTIEVMGQEEKREEADQKNMEQWQDFIKSKEERHFQIGRVIKYLSD